MENFLHEMNNLEEKDHPPFWDVLTSWCTRFLSSHGDFRETREKVKGKQTYRVNEGFDSGKKYEALNKCLAKPSILAFQLLVFGKVYIFWHVYSGIPEGGWGRSHQPTEHVYFFCWGETWTVYSDVIRQNKTLNVGSILLRGCVIYLQTCKNIDI